MNESVRNLPYTELETGDLVQTQDGTLWEVMPRGRLLDESGTVSTSLTSLLVNGAKIVDVAASKVRVR
jgi:hypothetical protein